MNEWIKKVLGQIRGLWTKWTLVQRLVLIGIVVAALGGIVALFAVSAAPTMTALIDAPIRDETARDRILTRLNEEGVHATVSPAGVVMVQDETTARRMRSILIREDLIPTGTDPWAIFDRDRWTITDFERNVNLQRSITAMVTEHVKALDDVDDANVTLVMPQKELFAADQKPVTASVIIAPRPGSDIATNRKKIEGIQKILKFAVEGLTDDNIVITDQNGLILNDFDGMQDLDRLELSKREQKHIASLEASYRASVLKALQQIYTSDRVRDLNVKIDMDMSKKAVQTEEFFPVEIKADNPDTPYDDSEYANSITRSKSTSSTKWEGTGFNPEGPAGVEGQTAPAFKDMSNLYGKVEQQTLTQNEEVNSRKIQEEKSPTIDRITVSVNIDGRWKLKRDAKGQPQFARWDHGSRVHPHPRRGAQEGPGPGPRLHRIQQDQGRFGDGAEHPVRPDQTIRRRGRGPLQAEAGPADHPLWPYRSGGASGILHRVQDHLQGARAAQEAQGRGAVPSAPDAQGERPPAG